MGLALRRRRAPERLAARGDVRGLIRALQPHGRDVADGPAGELFDLGAERRREAARHLAHVDDERATPALLERLGDIAPAVRLEVLRSLCARDDAPDATLVASLQGWTSDALRSDGAALLAARAAADGAAAARSIAAYVAADAGARLLPDGWLAQTFAALASEDREAAIEHAVGVLLDSDASRPHAHQLVRVARDASSPRLLELLERDAHRGRAAGLLGDLRSSAATEALLELLGAPDRELRRIAAVSLGQIQDPRAVDRLLAAAADEDFAVRDAAQRALDGFGATGLVWGIATVARSVLAERQATQAALEAAVHDRPPVESQNSDTAGIVQADEARATPAGHRSWRRLRRRLRQ